METSGEQTPEMAMRWKHGSKLMPCKRCGVGIRVGVRTRKSPQHLECSIRNMHDAMRQMQLKSGPLYEKWLENGGNKGRPRTRGTPFDQAKEGGPLKP